MAEKKYIERDAAIEALTERAESVKKLGAIGMAKDIKRVIKFIKKFPAADVVEVVHAHWIDRDGKTWCSNCDASNKQYKPPYCPHCGAKMDGGKHE